MPDSHQKCLLPPLGNAKFIPLQSTFGDLLESPEQSVGLIEGEDKTSSIFRSGVFSFFHTHKESSKVNLKLESGVLFCFV